MRLFLSVVSSFLHMLIRSRRHRSMGKAYQLNSSTDRCRLHLVHYLSPFLPDLGHEIGHWCGSNARWLYHRVDGTPSKGLWLRHWGEGEWAYNTRYLWRAIDCGMSQVRRVLVVVSKMVPALPNCPMVDTSKPWIKTSGSSRCQNRYVWYRQAINQNIWCGCEQTPGSRR